MKIYLNDTVRVTAGKDKGKEAKVVKVLKSDKKVVVEGVNIVKKHVKRDISETGIQEFEKPIDVSNVMIIDPKSKKPARVGFEMKDGKKVRVFKVSKNNK